MTAKHEPETHGSLEVFLMCPLRSLWGKGVPHAIDLPENSLSYHAPVSATSAEGLAIWKRICPKNVEVLVHPERCERHDNSEKIQCYSELSRVAC